MLAGDYTPKEKAAVDNKRKNDERKTAQSKAHTAAGLAAASSTAGRKQRCIEAAFAGATREFVDAQVANFFYGCRISF